MRWLGAVISLAVAAAPVLAETAAPVQPDQSASPPSGTVNPTQEAPKASPARPAREEQMRFCIISELDAWYSNRILSYQDFCTISCRR
jgi:hypothetical protein